MNIFIFTFALLFLSLQSTMAQDDYCNAKQIHEQRLQDAEYASHYDQFVSKVSSSSKKSGNLTCNSNNTVVIPVAVHFGSEFDCSNTQCLIDATQAQLKSVNIDFAAQNSDISKYYNLVQNYNQIDVASTGTCISFCLADQNHPSSTGMVDGFPAITVGIYEGGTAFGTNGAPEWAGYLNIFVKSSVPGPLGAQGVADGIPGLFNGDGVTISARHFGGPGFPACSSGDGLNDHMGNGGVSNTLGRTLTHEIGHFLGLFHTFEIGCSSGPEGPGVYDTPQQSNTLKTCVVVSSTGCQIPFPVGPSLSKRQFNFMDNFNGECFVMFTQDQASVMNTYANSLTLANDVINTGCADFSNVTLTPQIIGLPTSTFSTAPISLTGIPAGGTFSGPGVFFNGFNPVVAGPGIHTITYTVNNDNGCNTVTQDIFIFTIVFTDYLTGNLGILMPKLIDPDLNSTLNNDDIYNLEIVNLNGQVLYKSEIKAGAQVKNLTIGNFPKGSYIAHIFNDKHRVAEKFVITH